MPVYALGLDIGGTDLKLGIVSTEGRIIHNYETPTGSGRTEVLKNISNAVKEMMRISGFSLKQIKGIGVGSPGCPDSRGKIIDGAVNMKGWNGTPLGEYMKEQFRIPVTVENDVAALAIGEKVFGSARPYRNIVCMAFGTGLGGGLIINGDIYRGKHGYAAEMGHVRVNSEKDAAVCNCGRRGCMEIYTSRVGIERIIRKHMAAYPATKVRAGSSPKEVYDLAKQKDTFARYIVDEVGYRVGIGIADLVHLFDPDAVLIGGGIAKAGKIFYDAFMPVYEKELLPFYRTRKPKFIKPKLGKQGGIVGTAALILRRHTGKR